MSSARDDRDIPAGAAARKRPLTLKAERAAAEHLRAAGGQLEALAVTVDPCLTNLAALHLRQCTALAHHVLDPGPD
jgi:hypothetical protein